MNDQDRRNSIPKGTDSTLPRLRSGRCSDPYYCNIAGDNLIFFGNILGDPGKLGTETYSNIILKVVKEVNQRRFFVVNTTGAKC